MKSAEFANKIDSEETACSKPPRMALHCVPSIFSLNLNILGISLTKQFYEILQMQLLFSAFFAL